MPKAWFAREASRYTSLTRDTTTERSDEQAGSTTRSGGGRSGWRDPSAQGSLTAFKPVRRSSRCASPGHPVWVEGQETCIDATAPPILRRPRRDHRDRAAVPRRGPYRFTRHPKYVIASLEILVLPLAFGQIWIALAWTIANAMLLAWRIRVEDGALADRR
ncbi:MULTISPECIES: isoprenylcysteine carboxylmethyltransferase family protein [Brevundimonas]|jgi:Isoprenylcysteine carboxyl methyltransferase (ICMT) family|uniref:isoprenylcysteine carboxylmethyltransferase family protein n=1 Tax=Brevundimonas TaxID=41275 RepID=UPI0009EC04ED|nr:hypothetical protein [Brevundimonas sp.]MBY0250383.1 hypothetical protein [Methylobacterium organophilum]